MQVQINNAGSTPGVNNDLTVVNGAATLGGGTVVVQPASGTYTSGTRYIFLEATTISGTFSSITGFNGLNVHGVLGYGDIVVGGTDYETAYFTLMANQSDFAAIAQTPNQLGVANYIDIASLNPSPRHDGAHQHTQHVDRAPATGGARCDDRAGSMARWRSFRCKTRRFSMPCCGRRVGSAFAAGGLVEGSDGDDDLLAAATRRAGNTPVIADQLQPERLERAQWRQHGRGGRRWAAVRRVLGWVGRCGYGLGGSAQSDGQRRGRHVWRRWYDHGDGAAARRAHADRILWWLRRHECALGRLAAIGLGQPRTVRQLLFTRHGGALIFWLPARRVHRLSRIAADDPWWHQ